MQKSALVTGAGGQLGAELVRELEGRGWNVTGLDRHALDITDPVQVSAAVAASKPGVVLNAAAYNQVDLAESDPMGAYQVNALAVRNLALACQGVGARLVHYSTDYVFDGLKGGAYVEADATHPVSAYGVSKLAGECYARAYLDEALVVRTAAVFGPEGRRTARGNFVEMMLRLAAKGKVRVVADQGTSPSYAPALARMSVDLVELGARGVFHGGGPEGLTWFEYAARVFEAVGVKPELERTTGAEFRAPARRPPFSALRNAKAEALGLRPLPSLDESLRDYFARRDA